MRSVTFSSSSHHFSLHIEIGKGPGAKADVRGYWGASELTRMEWVTFSISVGAIGAHPLPDNEMALQLWIRAGLELERSGKVGSLAKS